MIDVLLKHGPSKIPVQALVVISSITLLFIMIGQINILAPIVCMPYMLIYGAVNYASFALLFKEKSHESKVILDQRPVVPGTYVEIPSSIKKLDRKSSTERDILLTPKSSSSDLKDYGTPKSYGSVGGQEDTPVTPPSIEVVKTEDENLERPYALDIANKWVSLFGVSLQWSSRTLPVVSF